MSAKPREMRRRGDKVEVFRGNITGITWDAGTMLIALPFSREESRFCLQLGPSLFGEFEVETGVWCFNSADSGDILANACTLARLTGVSEEPRYPVLSPRNAPVHRQAAEAAVFTKGFRRR